MLRINNAQSYFEKMNSNIEDLYSCKDVFTENQNIKQLIEESKFKKNIINLLSYAAQGVKALTHETGERLANAKNLFLINCDVMKIKKIMSIDSIQRKHVILKVGSYFAGMIFFIYGMNIKIPKLEQYYEYADTLLILFLAAISFIIYSTWVKLQRSST